MRSLRLAARIIGYTIAGAVLLALLLFGAVLLRKSMPYVFAGDIERLAASGPFNSESMATALCGRATDMVGSAETESPLQGLPRGRILSWRPLHPIEGMASVRVSGIGFDRRADRPTGPCEATMTFRYRFVWAYNGRAVVMESAFADRPTITRP